MTPDRETRIEKKLDDVLTLCVANKTKIDDHKENHVTQPCLDMKTLNGRIFAVAVLAIGGLVASLWKYVTGEA